MFENDRRPRELERAGALCLAFVNTILPSIDDRRRGGRASPSTPLATYEELLVWTVRMGVLEVAASERLRRAADERPEDAAAVVERAAHLRGALGRIFSARPLNKEPQPKDLDILNASLWARRVLPTWDGFHRDWEAGPETLDLLLWPIAHSAAELLSSKKYPRVNQCAAKGCYRLFVGNKRRKWCDANTCGSRLKGRRSYRLHKRRGQKIDEKRHREAALRKDQWARQKRLEAKKRKAMERKAAKAAAESKDAEEPDPEGSEQP